MTVGPGMMVDPGVRRAPMGVAATMVPRRTLLDRLDAATGARVVQMAAPAGHGKSVLAGQWRDRCLSRGGRVAWLSLGPEDDSPAGLEALLAGAMAEAREGTAPGQVEDGLLLLDGAHLVDAAILTAVLEPLVRRLPAGMRLGVTGRMPVRAGLAALRARGLVLDLRAADLRLTRDEIQHLFNHALTPAELAEVERQTEGWPVAVQFARRWWQGQGERMRLPHLADGLADEIADYLAEEMLDGIDGALLSDIVRIGILDRLGPVPVRHLLGQDESWYRLCDHPVLGSFLAASADDPQVFHPHPVLAQALRRRFQRLGQGERSHLRRRAADWCHRHGDLIGAVRHAMHAGDADLAVRMVEAAGGAQEIWMRFGYGVIKALDDMLDDGVLATYPRMKLLHALTLIKTGRLTEARRAFEEVRRTTGDFATDPTGRDPTLLRIDGLIVESTLFINECAAVNDGRLALYVDAVSSSVRLAPGTCQMVLASAKTAICISRYQRGRFDDALSASAEAMAHYRQADCPHGEFYNHLHMASIHGAQGRPVAAEEAIATAHGIARRHLADDPAKEKLIAALSADIAYERDQIALAHRRLRQVGDAFQEEAWFDILAALHGTAAMVALAAQGPGAALARLELATADIARRQVSGLDRFLDALRMSCLALSGRADDALSLRDRTGLTVRSAADMDLWREREAVLLANGRLALLRRDPDMVLEMLADVLPGLRLADNQRSLIRMGALAALAAAAARRDDMAEAHLREVLLLSARTGYRRIFREEGRAMVDLLERFVARTAPDMDDPAQTQARVLFADFTAGPDRYASLVLLTGSERRVLEELRAGHPDKVIARHLDLTLNTVKFHLKNIYAKLGVTGRAELIGNAVPPGPGAEDILQP